MDITPHLSPDGDEYVTQQQAAQLMGVDPSTIRTWERRGHLSRLPGCPPRRPLYSLTGLIEAEHQAREAAQRTSGSEARVVRHFTPDTSRQAG